MNFSKRKVILFVFIILILISIINFRVIGFDNDRISPSVFNVIDRGTIFQNDVDNKQVLWVSEILFSTAATDIDRNKNVFAVQLTF